MRVFSLSALSTAIKMLTAFVSVKVLALLVGPSGIALLGQLNNFSTILLTISTGGINNGVTKYTAQYANSQEELNPILQTSFRIIITLSFICCLALILGAPYFSGLILKDRGYVSIFVVFGITIFFYAINNFFLSILNGYKEFKKFIRINIISSIIGLLFTVTSVYFWGIYGAFLSAVTYQSVVFLVTLIAISKTEWFKLNRIIGKFNKDACWKLTQYSLMTLVGALMMPVAQLIIRDLITRNISVEDAGIWEGLNRISAMYLMIVTTSLSVYYLPRLSELKHDNDVRSEIIKVYKAIFLPLIGCSVLIFVFRDLIIRILFNNAFSEMRVLFAFQLVGDLFKVAGWILAYQFIAKAMIKTYVIVEIMFCVVFVSISSILISRFGTIGATIAYAVTYGLYTFVVTYIFRKLLFKKT